METWTSRLLLVASALLAWDLLLRFLGTGEACPEHMIAELENEKKERRAERTGRIRAQKELRRHLASSSGSAAPSTAPSSFPFIPIGTLRSCFSTRNGTPRQPLLVPSARARLELLPERGIPALALDGLDEFSHVWLVYVFHANTDLFRLWADPNHRFQHGKVHVPRLDGAAKGVLATRSPHRPVPIGLSVAKVERVEGSTIYLSGADVVDGTPVLDVKPYLPFCDAVPGSTVPEWVKGDGGAEDPLSMAGVAFGDEFGAQLATCWESLQMKGRGSLYDSPEELKELVRQVLRRDIRSVYQRGGGETDRRGNEKEEPSNSPSAAGDERQRDGEGEEKRGDDKMKEAEEEADNRRVCQQREGSNGKGAAVEPFEAFSEASGTVPNGTEGSDASPDTRGFEGTMVAEDPRPEYEEHATHASLNGQQGDESLVGTSLEDADNQDREDERGENDRRTDAEQAHKFDESPLPDIEGFDEHGIHSNEAAETKVHERDSNSLISTDIGKDTRGVKSQLRSALPLGGATLGGFWRWPTLFQKPSDEQEKESVSPSLSETNNRAGKGGKRRARRGKGAETEGKKGSLKTLVPKGGKAVNVWLRPVKESEESSTTASGTMWFVILEDIRFAYRIGENREVVVEGAKFVGGESDSKQA